MRLMRKIWVLLAGVVAVGAAIAYAGWPSASEPRPTRAAPGTTVATLNPTSEPALNARGNNARTGPYLIPLAPLERRG